jgi:hypothetical protein
MIVVDPVLALTECLFVLKYSKLNLEKRKKFIGVDKGQRRSYTI